MKNRGFTLAEVLITLGIIGVVAALTIPGLINNYKAARLHSQFLKSYSTIQQAFKQMEADDLSLNPADYDRYKAPFFETFRNYFKIAINCSGGIKSKPCYNLTGSGYKSYDGISKISPLYFDDCQFVLNDGTFIVVDAPAHNQWIWVSVDLNGYDNPPNRWGYDLFTFQFADGELVTMGDKKSDYTDMSKYCSKTSTEELNGIACAQKAKENPDYFKELIKEFK